MAAEPLRIFLSYQSASADLAEEIFAVLTGEKRDGRPRYSVFLDREKVHPSDPVSQVIRENLQQADILVFLLTSAAVQPGAYSLTELEIARERWPSPTGRVLTVGLENVARKKVPPYLRAGIVHMPKGNIAGTVALKVEQMASRLESPHQQSPAAIEGITRAAGIRGVLVEARANRPITTRLELLVNGKVVAHLSRPAITSLVAGVRTILGLQPRWSIGGDVFIQDKNVALRADFVTTFTNQYWEMSIDGVTVS